MTIEPFPKTEYPHDPNRTNFTYRLSGFICEVTAEPVSPAECLACARGGAPGCNMTELVIKGILYILHPDDFGLTVKTLLGCSRKARFSINQLQSGDF